MKTFPTPCCRLGQWSLGLTLLLLIGLLTFLAWPPPKPATAKADPKTNAKATDKPDPHSPEAELKSFQVLDGFEVNLFASEPMLANPIQMTWDAQGRLWVACSYAYPQIKPGQKANDQIIILEDTNNDGKADKRTVFADGLYVPTGLEIGDGGVYVANPPNLLFLKDTTGDGKADHREIVLSGFGTEDNHHSISAWRWGPGGWLYFQEGTFLHSQVETPYGLVRLENGGVFQFRPKQRKLRVFADYRASNPWGHMITAWGQNILIDNPNIYFMAPLTANSRAKLPYNSLLRANTKHCGGDIVSGRHLPKEFQGQIWTNAYKTHAVDRFQLVDAGSGFNVKPLPPLIHSTSEVFRPVDLKMGPDGAVYIADWYNPLIGHMQYEFRDPRRDLSHGRIWRVTYKGNPLVEKKDLTKLSTPDLLQHLKDPEDQTRHQVKRVLSIRDSKKTVEHLRAFVGGLDESDKNYPHHLTEALWTFQTIDHPEPDLLQKVLNTKNPDARAAALRVLRDWWKKIKDPLALLEKAVADDNARVRLEAVLTCSFIPKPDSMRIALHALDKTTDRHIDHALKLTVDGLQSVWQPAFEAKKLKFDKENHLAFALSSAQASASLVKPMLALLNSGSVTPDQIRKVIGPVIAQANSKQLELVWERTTGSMFGGLKPGATEALLNAFHRAATSRKVMPTSKLGTVVRFLGSDSPRVRAAAARLAGAWKLKAKGTVNFLIRLAKSSDEPTIVRQAAFEALATIGGKPNQQLIESLAKKGPLDQQYLATAGWARYNLNAAAQQAAQLLQQDPKNANLDPMLQAFVNRKKGEGVLAQALEKTKPSPASIEKIRDYLNRTGIQPPQLLATLNRLAPPVAVLELLMKQDAKQLAQRALEKGDPKRGEILFRSKELACVKCHAINGAGPSLGPELGAIGASSPADYLVHSILRPSLAIKDQYQTVTIATADGDVKTGILSYKDDKQVVILDATKAGRKVTILADDIDEMTNSKKSLMPEGLASKLRTEQDFLDMIQFLHVLGRPGPYAASTLPRLRRWRVWNSKKIPASADELKAVLKTPAQPLYSKVDGTLPEGELQEAQGDQSTLLLQASLDAAAPGKIRLRFDDIAGITSLWINSREVKLTANAQVVEVPAGRVNITVVLDANKLKKSLRCTVTEPAGSGANVQIVGGV